MEFHELKKTGLLTEKEAKVINKLTTQGNKLLDLLNQEVSYEKLDKMITSYASAVDASKEMIEGVIERTLDEDSDLSVHVNELITNTQELLMFKRKAGIIDKYGKVITNRLEKMLALNKVFLKLGYPITFSNRQSRLTRQGITLNLAHADVDELVSLLISNHKQEIEKNFLITQERAGQAGIVDSS